MNNIQIFTLILVTSLTTQTKCPDATNDTNENAKLKLGFEIENGTITLIKDLTAVVIARNHAKTSKYHIDTLVEEKDNKRWVFENDTRFGAVSTETIDNALDALDNGAVDKNQDFYTSKFGIEDKDNLEVFATEFHTEGGLLCDAAYKMVDRAFDFYVGLGKKISPQIGDLIDSFISQRKKHSQMRMKLYQPFGEDDFAKDDETFNQGFLLSIDNEHLLGFFKGYLLNGFKEVSQELFNSDPNNAQLVEGPLAQKKLEMDNAAKHMAPIMADLPTIQTTVQIPLEMIPALFAKLEEFEIRNNQILNWFGYDCDDEGAAKKELCKLIKKAECNGNTISRRVMGLALLTSQFLINGTFQDGRVDMYDMQGLKTLFDFQPRVGIKKMFRKLSQNDKRDFRCLYAPENYYQDYVLINYNNYQNENQVNSDDPKTVQDYFDSIYADNDNADLLSPPPGMGASDSMGALDVPGDCTDCAIIEIRGFNTLSLGRENDFYYKNTSHNSDDYGKETVRRGNIAPMVLMKDIKHVLKTFAKTFYEITAIDFEDFGSESESSEEQVVVSEEDDTLLLL